MHLCRLVRRQRHSASFCVIAFLEHADQLMHPANIHNNQSFPSRACATGQRSLEHRRAVSDAVLPRRTSASYNVSRFQRCLYSIGVIFPGGLATKRSFSFLCGDQCRFLLFLRDIRLFSTSCSTSKEECRCHLQLKRLYFPISTSTNICFFRSWSAPQFVGCDLLCSSSGGAYRD